MTVSSVRASGGAQGSSASSAINDVGLGKSDFLRLLITELRYQDAFQPVDDKEMLAQLAQFSTLEHMQNLTRAVEDLAKAQNVAQVTALIGKTVSGTASSGEAFSGVVSGVEFLGQEAYLVVDGRRIPLSQVTTISQG